jgi:Dolichyl-phosphate-mannose-protein mannosyltransferase
MDLDREQGRRPGQRGGARSAIGLGLGLVALGSFLLLFHNYGLNLLPYRRIRIPADQIRPYGAEKSFAYVFAYDLSKPDDSLSQQSRVRFAENGQVYPRSLRTPAEVILVGGDRFTHEAGRIVFASTDNTDPRQNGRTYEVLSPRLYTRAVGVGAAILFAASVMGLYWLKRGDPVPAATEAGRPSRWRWHAVGASLLFLTGLYFNTGTLAPYAITYFPRVNKTTGYLYNEDHVHFRVLFDFVDGKDRAVWDKALLLRRVLYPVLAWPLMKLAGFEIGGTLASLLLNVLGFVLAVGLIRRRVGERGAVFAAWTLALYPGVTYWGGLPYPYALIFPTSLLLLLAMLELETARRWRAVIGISLVMGVAYLGYDLIVFFLPATVLVLAWRRRWAAAAVSGLVQMMPLGLWLLILARGLHQPLENSNTALFRTILSSFRHFKDLAQWWAGVSNFADIGLDVFFASNFLFLPALFLAVVAFNPVTARIRFRPAEASVLLVALGLFLLNNLAPPYGGTWGMRGTWIARLYQPIFPVLVLYAARWWQQRPPLRGLVRDLVWGVLVCAAAGNALIVFGPILDNPFQVSEHAFYRFYNDTDFHPIYEASLKAYGRRPLGFPRPQP